MKADGIHRVNFAATRPENGLQTPHIKNRLRPIGHMVTPQVIDILVIIWRHAVARNVSVMKC